VLNSVSATVDEVVPEPPVSYGKLEVIERFRPDPKRDDVRKLLVGWTVCRDSEIAKLLLDVGAETRGPMRGAAA